MSASQPQAVEAPVRVVTVIDGRRTTARIALRWACPTCKGPRGEPHVTFAYDGSERIRVDGWENPCGHTDSYASVLEEATFAPLKAPLFEEVAARFRIHGHQVHFDSFRGERTAQLEVFERHLPAGHRLLSWDTTVSPAQFLVGVDVEHPEAHPATSYITRIMQAAEDVRLGQALLVGLNCPPVAMPINLDALEQELGALLGLGKLHGSKLERRRLGNYVAFTDAAGWVANRVLIFAHEAVVFYGSILILRQGQGDAVADLAVSDLAQHLEGLGMDEIAHLSRAFDGPPVVLGKAEMLENGP